jgi:hypothetical protein
MRDEEAPETTKAQLDEQKIARGVALGLPLVTLSTAAIVGVLVGPATSILVIAAGLLLGVIALLWGSLRILSGDAALSPELEALDMAAQGVDALASRKKMLLRALKDLENERGIGKIEEDDYGLIATTYREELKAVLRRIDDSLAPHRSRAEEAARAYLVRAGITGGGADDEPAADAERESSPKHASSAKTIPKETRTREPDRRVKCPDCKASNEPDAKFCKECAAKLGTTLASDEPSREVSDEA